MKRLLAPALGLMLIVAFGAVTNGSSGAQAARQSVTLRAEVWADNWFALYSGETLIREDSVPISTERSFNAEVFTFQASYPLQLNFVVKDFKENDTGLEYIGTPRQQIGDGGLIAQFTDLATGRLVAVTNARAKVFVTHKAPLDRDCAKEARPVAGQGKCVFSARSEPAGWKKPDFDDSTWSQASLFSAAQVQPKDGYDQIRWSPTAQFIWSSDLLADNTVLVRMTVEAPAAGQFPTQVASARGGQVQSVKAQTADLEAACKERVARFAAAGNSASAHCEGGYLVVESDGLAQEQMMVGITAWQQQVPLPQPYTGRNAFLIPLVPLPSSTPTRTSGVGAVAVALNGVPIFNPSKPSQGGNQEVYDPRNDPKLIGELDACGGHSGRGDDYHYHAGPVCFLDKLGGKTGGVVGYAIDGYPVMEFHDAGEKLPDDLDDCNGHDSGGLGYHYHLTQQAPYVVGCYHGSVAGAFQPQTLHLRPAGGPIRATITDLNTETDGWTTVRFTYNNAAQTVAYRKEGNCYQFRYPEPPPPTSPGRGSVTYCERR